MIKVSLILGFLILFGCRNQTQNHNIDSKNPASADSLITIKQYENELIFYFFSRFATETDFQLSRIRFPLPILEDKQTSLIEKDEWKHDYLYLTLEYRTHINDSQSKPLDLSADYGDKSIFSWIYPSLKKRKDYYFIRENSKWYLSKIAISSLNFESSESFIPFLQNFMNDSSFQTSRIKFPILLDTWYDSDAEIFKDTTYSISQSEWRFNSLYNGLDSMTNFSNDWNPDLKPNDEVTLYVSGVENGIAVIFYFQKIDNKWYLIRKADEST